MERNLRKERVGVVVSNKMEKTIVVAVRWKEGEDHRGRCPLERETPHLWQVCQ